MALQEFPDISKSTRLSDGTTYAFVRVKAASPAKPTFLLLHGFPSTSYDWRHQIHSLKQSGYGIIAPDLLGYASTDAPLKVEAYKLKRMADHLAELLDTEDVGKVIVVGHDWGSFMAGRFANWHPTRALGVVFISVVYVKPEPFDLDAVNQLTEQFFGYPIYGYFPFFNKDDAGDICNQHVERVSLLGYCEDPEDWKRHLCPYGAFAKFLESDYKPRLAPWMQEEELQKHNALIMKTGFTAPINWYKAMVRGVNDEDEAQLPKSAHTINVPVLFILSDKDFAGRSEIGYQTAEQGQKEGFLPNIDVKCFEGAGHWIPLEKPDETTRMIEDFGVKTWAKGGNST